ncbi:uncharacterized protein LOC110457103 [Mizuhopecten yessoensis]|uniref:Asparagine-rich protein n=1 Tax=Mizuhopecten yessoensis TaxID=6573 RepID=A0A210Q9I8_MIZYE|nr:uncharacterized protein LOC110457103 [Mizuhopecten yessoensis]XP_021363878.1 uncharacterized protein LOC110457103 [Mizuhopecten yessoensis]OWF45396.1 Asparagine-rich protein [Mizuhopecten yessoensis]
MYSGLVLILALFPVLYGQDVCSRCQGANLCLAPDANDCRMFNICQNKRRQIMRCSFGTFFDVDNNICNYPSRVRCPRDPCKGVRSPTSYADGNGNCRHYWKCIDGLSTALCCKEGTSYNSDRSECVADANCTDSCTLYSQSGGPAVTGRVQVVCGNEKSTLRCSSGDVIRIHSAVYGGADPMTCMIEQDTSSCPNIKAMHVLGPLCNDKQSCEVHIPSVLSDHCPDIAKQVEIRYVCEAGCKLRPGKDGRSFYNLASKGTTMTCGLGTRFNAASCGCIGTGEAPQCRLEVQVLFGKTDEGQIKNMADSGIHIESHNVLQVSGYGRFLGSSRIQIPFYNNNDRMSRMFGFQLRIFPLPSDSTKQVLLSNCQSDAKVLDSPSLEVYLAPLEKKIYFRAVNNLEVDSQISVPYIDETWSNVLFLFNGRSMFAKLQYVEPNTKILREATDNAPFSGKIKIGLSPLKIGSCRDNDGVKAYIDEIQMSFCKTRFPDASAASPSTQNSPQLTTDPPGPTLP